ncbi:leucine-rich repeat neuronal protein 2 [Lucilia cuprina]|uniref:leucine-rich repeat neuronal protein 2 n=1 Tax=Lucilia cuprina TaxID=7375 RepID=UPI001F0701CA|nr:leucine-rich repeat neuronal protein 2 [Lucilia cuprina]
MMTNHKSWLIIAALLLVSQLCIEISAEAIEPSDVELFCYPELHKNTRKSCECISEGSAPWGLRVLNIDCSFKSLLTADFSEILPPYADRLDLTWNQLEHVPMLASDSLTLLNLMHNNISVVLAKNFAKISNLHELYLSWNSIQTIEPYAFSDLPHLLVLDLSHNNLHNLAFQLFLPLQSLETLNLSWNRQLNQTEGIQELDFYQTYGVNNKLRTLKLKACNLNKIVLPKNVVLKELDLRRNSLTEVPESLPEGLEKIDLSENLFVSLTELDAKRLRNIHELYMEDMPILVSIEENSLVPLESVEKISFQNSRSLVDMHEYTFGQNATRSPNLHTMIFRGTAMRGFNNTLSPIFFQLATLDLNGMPLHCDCNLVWIKEVRIETHGRCLKPSRLRGVSLAKADPNDFSCERWPRWVYGIIILALIALCSICIYFIVVGLRPNGGVTMRRKVGAGSPYARVTIEPNRQEHN